MGGQNERKDVKFIDEEENAYGIKHTDNEPHVRAKLVSSADVVLDPATEDKQDDIIDQISDLSQTKGGQEELRISDDVIQQLLTNILKELKLMNLHLDSITDEGFTKEEFNA